MVRTEKGLKTGFTSFTEVQVLDSQYTRVKAIFKPEKIIVQLRINFAFAYNYFAFANLNKLFHDFINRKIVYTFNASATF